MAKGVADEAFVQSEIPLGGSPRRPTMAGDGKGLRTISSIERPQPNSIDFSARQRVADAAGIDPERLRRLFGGSKCSVPDPYRARLGACMVAPELIEPAGLNGFADRLLLDSEVSGRISERWEHRPLDGYVAMYALAHHAASFGQWS